MNVPIYAATVCRVVGCKSNIYEAIEVVTAAKPTKAWNAATVYGNSVTLTCYPMYLPATPATPSKVKA